MAVKARAVFQVEDQRHDGVIEEILSRMLRYRHKYGAKFLEYILKPASDDIGRFGEPKTPRDMMTCHVVVGTECVDLFIQAISFHTRSLPRLPSSNQHLCQRLTKTARLNLCLRYIQLEERLPLWIDSAQRHKPCTDYTSSVTCLQIGEWKISISTILLMIQLEGDHKSLTRALRLRPMGQHVRNSVHLGAP